MKVLFVAHSAQLSGGANRSLLALMAGLRDRWGVDPSVLVPIAGGELQRVCEEEKIPVFVGNYHTCCTVYQHEVKDVLRFCKLFVAPVADWISARKLNTELPRDFDLVYSNERMIVIGAYFAQLRKIPHIWHVRSFAQENSTHYPPFYYQLMDRLSHRIVLISKALYSAFAEHISEGKLRMIHNGVEQRDYSVDKKIPHQGFRLLLTGRIVPPKGQMEAVQALEILCRSSSYRFDLYFAGESPAYEAGDYRHKLCEEISTAGIQDHIHFLGEVHDMSRLRSEMDFELVCSWCETFGRVTVEAMCAKLPVIGSDAGGTPEIIVPNQTGLLYRPHDAEQLAERILWYAEHPKVAAEMAERGYLRAKKHFSIDATVYNVFKTISDVMTEETGKR